VIRVSINLDRENCELARHEADRLGTLSEFARRAVRRELNILQTAPWMAYAGIVDCRETDAARNVDRVVYGG